MNAFENRSEAGSEAGFTLIELLVALVVSLLVVGGATMLGSQMQTSYRLEMEGAAAQQEARNAIQLIQSYVRGAGNNPYKQIIPVTTDCPSAGTPIIAIRMDPNANGIQDDIRLQMDSNPPDALFGGAAGACDEANEDVTIAHVPAYKMITLTDNNVGKTPQQKTDSVITSLLFVYRDSARNLTTIANNIAFVETQVTAVTTYPAPGSTVPRSYTLTNEVRLRVR